MIKLFVILFSFISFYGYSKTKPEAFLINYKTISNDTIDEITVSSSKLERYKIYLEDCNEIVKDTITQTGFLEFDTIRVVSVPESKLFSGKSIIKSVEISQGIANIIVVDTIWNDLEAPEYRSTWEYYVLAKHPIPISNEPIFDYSDKILVFRQKVYVWKKRKPLIFDEWDKFINNKKSSRKFQSEQYF
jgi:hypothetical protein